MKLDEDSPADSTGRGGAQGEALVDPILAFLGLMIGALVLLGLVAIVGGFLQTRRERLLTHQERLKALELGREIPDDVATARMKVAGGITSSGEKADSSDNGEGATGALSRKCFSTAVWVAFWGFLAASQNSLTQSPTATIAVAIAIAASAAAIGITAVICGTILAVRTSTSRDQRATRKAEIERDALDVVSRRG
jgi:hypothetical protein